MDLNKEQLEKIKEYASKFLPISDIALLMDLPVDELKRQITVDDSPANKAYRSGKAMTKLTIHEQELELVKVGSPQALENLNQMLLDMEDEEV